MPAFYEPLGDDRFAATELTRGPWSAEHQHAGPPTALLARSIERASSIADGQTARLTVDILRPVPIAALEVRARVLRPGRRVEQLEATLLHDGTELMRATAWRLRRAAMAAAHDPDPPPSREATGEVRLPFWEGNEIAYHHAFEWRLVSGSVTEPGPACVWTRMTCDLVEGEPAAPLSRLLAMADAASGVSWAADWDRYVFPNVDYSVHLERPPHGEWMAMDARTRIGPDGAGQCLGVLFDERGSVGVSTQTLLIDAR